MSENKIDNNCLSFCQPSEVDLQKRDFLVKATAATGAVGVAAVAVPFVGSMLPSERAKAAEYTRELAQQGMAPALSYQVKLVGNKLVWATEDNGQRHMLTSEPGGMWRRFNAWISKAVGLEKML